MVVHYHLPFKDNPRHPQDLFSITIWTLQPRGGNRVTCHVRWGRFGYVLWNLTYPGSNVRVKRSSHPWGHTKHTLNLIRANKINRMHD